MEQVSLFCADIRMCRPNQDEQNSQRPVDFDSVSWRVKLLEVLLTRGEAERRQLET
jgi:hypothetical protein